MAAIGSLGLGCSLLSVPVFGQAFPADSSPPARIRQTSPQHQQAPPVHVSPGSATAQPINGFRPKLQVVQNPHQSQPAVGLQDRIEQVFNSSRLGRDDLDRTGRSRQLSQASSPNSSRQPQSTTKMTPQSVVSHAENRHSERFAANHAAPSTRFNNPMTARAVAIPSQASDVPAQLAGHQTDDFDPDILTATLEQSLDELWADDQPKNKQVDNWSPRPNSPSSAAPTQSSSVLDWDEQSLPTTPAGSFNQVNSSQRMSPRLIPNGSPQNPRFRQDLEELELPPTSLQNSLQNPNRGGLRSLMDEPEEIDLGRRGSDDDQTSLLDRSCDYYRGQLFSTNIQDIALDLSPPKPGTLSATSERLTRNWTDRSGNVIASGTLVDMQRGYIILENGQRIAYGRLGEQDLIVIADHWNLPRTCGVENRGDIHRYWHPMTYTYTASSLCHKPLYFENIQLERYGHTHGPIMQPVHSVAHFFVRLVTLPYHTALHPANECQYALGLYRPGDCAPWLKDPIPLSLSGARRQAAVTGGWIAILP